jgi:hypothetical protein
MVRVTDMVRELLQKSVILPPKRAYKTPLFIARRPGSLAGRAHRKNYRFRLS